jgi:hypothetical protein
MSKTYAARPARRRARASPRCGEPSQPSSELGHALGPGVSQHLAMVHYY